MSHLVELFLYPLIETVCFGFGRLVLQVLSFGRISLDDPSPLQFFLVAVLGISILIGIGYMIAAVGY